MADNTNWPAGVLELRFVSDGPMILLADRRVKKDVIPTGTHIYRAVNPETKKLERCELVVPESRIDHWVEQGNAMLAAGIEVPMPLDHDANDSERNRGFVTRFYKERRADGRAWLSCEAEIPDVPGSAYVGKTIREVSAGVARTIEKAGKIWNDVVAHVSPCINPVITGQGNFVTLKQVAGSEPFSGGQDMDELMKLLTDMSGCAQRAGVDLKDLTPENALEKTRAILAKCGSADAALKDLQANFDSAQVEVVKLKADLVTSTGQVVELKAKYEPAAATPTVEEIRLKAELATKETEITALKSKEIDIEVAALLADKKIVATSVPTIKALLSGARSESGLVCLKDTKDGKDVVTEMSVADGVRAILKSLPPGAAFATGKPASGAKEVPLPKDGEDGERAELKDKANEIAKRDGITFEQALPKAEVELRS